MLKGRLAVCGGPVLGHLDVGRREVSLPLQEDRQRPRRRAQRTLKRREREQGLDEVKFHVSMCGFVGHSLHEYRLLATLPTVHSTYHSMVSSIWQYILPIMTSYTMLVSRGHPPS